MLRSLFSSLHRFGARAPGLLAAAALALPGCDSNTGVDDSKVVVTVVVSSTASSVDIQSQLQMQAVALNAENQEIPNVTFQWSSSDPARATVSGTGLVTGQARGPVLIAATAGQVVGTFSLQVTDPFPPDPPQAPRADPFSHTAMLVSWTDASDTEGRFEVEREVDGSFTWIGEVGTDKTSFVDTGLEPLTVYRYRVRSCNANGCSDPVGPVEGRTNGRLLVSSGSLKDGEIQLPFADTLSASGGDGTYTWSLATGTLPQGLTLSENGVVSGTPSERGTFQFTAAVQSGDLQTAQGQVSLFVLGPVEIVTDTLPEAQITRAYRTTLQAVGGEGAITWTLLSGALPEGISLNRATGVLSGIPIATDTFPFTVEARSEDAQADTAQLVLEVVQRPLEIITSNLPTATVGETYLGGIGTIGGVAPNRYFVDGGQLPEGLSLNQITGNVFGVPVRVDTIQFRARVESGLEWDTATINLQVDPGLVTVSPYLPTGYRDTPYQGGVGLAGGDGRTYSVTLETGTLPPGMTLDASTGALQGSPTQPGVYFLSVGVESAGDFAVQDLTLTVSTRGPNGFNMGFLNVAPETPGEELQASLNEVLARWEEIIVGDLPFEPIPEDEFQGPGGGFCELGEPLNGQVVDDMVVLLDLGEIDGPGGTLGFAGPCYVREEVGGEVTTVVGFLRLDTQDLANWSEVRRFSVIWHEIAHIVGIGTLWDFGPYDFLLGRGGTNPRYTGPEGILGYASLGGAEATIALEDQFGPGTRDVHWRESTFQDEMMTGIYSGGGRLPISVMTVRSFRDVGYAVDLEAADNWTLPAQTSPSGAPGQEDTPAGIPFGDDILREPIVVRRADGSVIRIPPRN